VLGKEIKYAGDNLDIFEEQMRKHAPSWAAFDIRMMFQGYLGRRTWRPPQTFRGAVPWQEGTADAARRAAPDTSSSHRRKRAFIEAAVAR
jgi:hypothetical protein